MTNTCPTRWPAGTGDAAYAVGGATDATRAAAAVATRTRFTGPASRVRPGRAQTGFAVETACPPGRRDEAAVNGRSRRSCLGRLGPGLGSAGGRCAPHEPDRKVAVRRAQHVRVAGLLLGVPPRHVDAHRDQRAGRGVGVRSVERAVVDPLLDGLPHE